MVFLIPMAVIIVGVSLLIWVNWRREQPQNKPLPKPQGFAYIAGIVACAGVLLFSLYQFGYFVYTQFAGQNTPVVGQAEATFTITPTTAPSTATPAVAPSTATPAVARTSLQYTPTPTSLPDLLAAEKRAEEYYTALQNRQIDTAWEMLTNRCKASLKVNYNGFADLYTKKVVKIEIISIHGMNEKYPDLVVRVDYQQLTNLNIWEHYVLDLHFIKDQRNRFFINEVDAVPS